MDLMVIASIKKMIFSILSARHLVDLLVEQALRKCGLKTWF